MARWKLAGCFKITDRPGLVRNDYLESQPSAGSDQLCYRFGYHSTASNSTGYYRNWYNEDTNVQQLYKIRQTVLQGDY